MRKNIQMTIAAISLFFIYNFSLAGKTTPQHTEGLLKKNCYQTSGALKKMPAKKRDRLCTCIAEKVFERVRKPTDLSSASKRIIIEKSNEFFIHPKKHYDEDPLNIIDEIFNYTDSCLLEIDKK